MRKETNLKEISDLVISFLYTDYEVVDGIPPQFAIIHPVFESTIAGISDGDNGKIVDFYNNDDNLQLVRDSFLKRIKSSTTINELYCIVRKSYRLTFLKFAEPFLSCNDMSELLADAWTTSENPNQDNNVKLPMIVRWFKNANKKLLMDEEEYEVYKSLPDKFTVYRGVAIGRNPNGLSWTKSKSKAEWFSHRFDKNNNIGYIQSAIADKQNVLAYFNSRDEDEIVVDPKTFDNINIIS